MKIPEKQALLFQRKSRRSLLKNTNRKILRPRKISIGKNLNPGNRNIRMMRSSSLKRSILKT